MSPIKISVILLILAAASHAFSVGGRRIDNTTGTELAGTIVGGTLADIRDYPHQVFMVAGGAGCGAAIISTSWVLTAAHCCGSDDVRGKFRAFPANLVALRSGTTNKRVSGKQHRVLRVKPHEKYNSQSSDNDICLIKVKNQFVFNDRTQAIALPTSNKLYTSGTKAYASGWGSTTYGSSSVNQLRAVRIPIISNAECKELYSEHDEADDITDRQFCAYKPGRDTCQGDSGGALTAEGQLLGVVSWGIGCGDNPGVYTKVTQYRRWIKDNAGI